MESDHSCAHIIANILDQTSDTRISIGDHHGRFISDAQIRVLRDVVERLTREQSIYTPSASDFTLFDGLTFESLSVTPPPARPETPPSKNKILSEREQLKVKITNKRIEIGKADKSIRAELNEQLGSLISRRAALDKLIKNF